jgi:hypothetical protein
MAFVVGSVAALRVTGPQYTSSVQAQPPQFGVVTTAGAGTQEVLWPDGHLEATVPDTGLDEILSPDPANVTKFQGRYVRHTLGAGASSDSGGFDGYVVMLYKRAPGGGAGGPDKALVRTQTGFYMEFLVSELEVVPGN